LPKANIRLWKVAKIFHFLATFQVHPWTVLTFNEPVLRMREWLGKLVYEPFFGSQYLISDLREHPDPYTLNHWVVGSIPTRCMLRRENDLRVKVPVNSSCCLDTFWIWLPLHRAAAALPEI